jgi:hypothetical protein
VKRVSRALRPVFPSDRFFLFSITGALSPVVVAGVYPTMTDFSSIHNFVISSSNRPQPTRMTVNNAPALKHHHAETSGIGWYFLFFTVSPAGSGTSHSTPHFVLRFALG